jgi:hypothetical protein
MDKKLLALDYVKKSEASGQVENAIGEAFEAGWDAAVKHYQNLYGAPVGNELITVGIASPVGNETFNPTASGQDLCRDANGTMWKLY